MRRCAGMLALPSESLANRGRGRAINPLAAGRSDHGEACESRPPRHGFGFCRLPHWSRACGRCGVASFWDSSPFAPGAAIAVAVVCGFGSGRHASSRTRRDQTGNTTCVGCSSGVARRTTDCKAAFGESDRGTPVRRAANQSGFHYSRGIGQRDDRVGRAGDHRIFYGFIGSSSIPSDVRNGFWREIDDNRAELFAVSR